MHRLQIMLHLCYKNDYFPQQNLKEVRLSNNLTDIDEYVFVYCEKLAVVIPKSVK